MELDRRLFDLCAPALERSGYELVWVQVTGAGGTRRRVGIYIDKEGGVDVEDCATASRLIDPLIDGSGLFKSAFVLEVSSPGLDRPLYKRADYERFSGRKARVTLKRPLEGGTQRNFTGVLRGLDGESIVLEVESGDRFRLPLEDIHRANLVFEWK